MMNKSILTLFIASSFLLISRSSVLASAGDVWLSPAAVTATSSQAFDLQLHIDSGGKNIGAISAYLDFDPTKIALIDTISPISNGANGYNFMYNDENKANGTLRFSGICAQGCANSADVNLLTIHFRVLPSFPQGSADIAVRVSELTDDMGIAIPVGIMTGSHLTNPGVIIVPQDTYPAVRSNGSPSGVLAAGTVSTTLSLTTNEAATCKYATVANTAYGAMTGAFTTTGAGTHATNIGNLVGGNTYTYYVRCVDNVGNVNIDDYIISFKVAVATPTDLIVQFKSSNVYTRFMGKILLKVEDLGKTYYISMKANRGYYLADGNEALRIAGTQGFGTYNADLIKIPIGTSVMVGTDTDKDGLSDSLENAIGTDINKADTDGDGYSDRTEVETNNNPLGSGKMPVNLTFAKKQNGKILLQVERNGEAWYVYNGKRYYMGRPEDALEIMKKLSMGITNYDFNRYLIAAN